MKIGIHTWGSEGDVRPFVALGRGLVKRGHEVTLAYTSVDRRDYSVLAQQCGFRAIAVGAPYFADMRETLEAEMLGFAKMRNPLKQLRRIAELGMVPVLDEMYRVSKEVCAGTEVEVAHFVHHPGITAALGAGRPAVPVFTMPALPTRFLEPPGAPPLGRWLNPLLWRLVGSVMDRSSGCRPTACAPWRACSRCETCSRRRWTGSSFR